jgi:Mg2+/Co2+ transporter CorB
MITEWLLLGGAITLLLVISAFFSGSETALTAASNPRMHELTRQGSHRAEIVLAMRERRERLIGAILLGNNLVNIFASALATSLLLGVFGEAGVVYATLAMTLLILTFAELLPKTYALRQADKTALLVAPFTAKRSCAARSRFMKGRNRKSARNARCCAASSTSTTCRSRR